MVAVSEKGVDGFSVTVDEKDASPAALDELTVDAPEDGSDVVLVVEPTNTEDINELMALNLRVKDVKNVNIVLTIPGVGETENGDIPVSFYLLLNSDAIKPRMQKINVNIFDNMHKKFHH